MFNITQLNEVQLLVFGLALLRMTAFIFSASIFSAQSVPIVARILISLILTMMVFPSLNNNKTLLQVSEMQDQIIFLSTLEVVIGLCLGFLTRFFFFTVSMAGELISVALGLGQAQIFNPLLGSPGNAMEQFISMFATLIFFAINGHHIMLEGLIKSFSILHLASVQFNVIELKNIVLAAQDLFIIAIRLSAPILISMLVVQIGIGILSRAVPQINVLSTAASISTLVGIVLLIICLPLMTGELSSIVETTSHQLFRFMKGI